MAIPKPPRATYAEIEALPPHIVGEILFGVLHTQARPAVRHARASTRLGHVLQGPFEDGLDGPGGWVFLDEPELHFGRDRPEGPEIVVPDIAAWRVARLSPIPDAPYIEIAPDWVAEILSPSTQAIDRTDKLAVYATFGVGHCWYVDPIGRTLEVFSLGDDGQYRIAVTFRDRNNVIAPPFEATTLALDRLWLPSA